MTDPYYFLAIPGALALGAVFITFVSVCQAARDEEFEKRKQVARVREANQS